MIEQDRLSKNENIKQSMKATLEKRSSQTCFVYKVKIDESHLSNKQSEQLKMLFVEAKWLYNDILNFSKTNKISTYDTKSNFVNILNKDKQIEQKELKFIGSQMKQSVLTDILANLKGLKKLKENNHKVGWLKFKSNYCSLTLKQYGTTYKISGNKIKIQNISGKLKVNGLDQFINIPNIDIANAKLLNTPTGYYIAITVYRFNTDIPVKNFIGKEIGIDMGIKNHITLSNGEKFNSTIKETERLKHLQRKLSRCVKGSNNRRKIIRLIDKEYQKITNRINDAANKVLSYILSFENIYMQDEQISNWKKGLFGKQIQHSILGRVKGKLINHPRVQVLDRFAPTTKFCPKCHNIKKDITLNDRIYKCNNCGYKEDRDIHSANNMIIMIKLVNNQINLVPTGHRDFKPVETNTTISKTSETSIVNEAGSSPIYRE